MRSLADGGIVFDHAVSTAPWTTPSMMSVLTGLYPWSHHVRDHNFTLAESVPLLAERLKGLGYSTAAVVPSATLREDFGFARGFDFFSNGRYGHNVVTSPPMTGEALAWLERDAPSPFFLWVHYWDPHYNYLPPKPYDEAFESAFHPAPGQAYDIAELKNLEWPLSAGECDYLRSQYDGEILYTDRYLGDLLDLLDREGVRQRTLIVLIGDHGEAFQEHALLGHTARVDEEMIRVPLVFNWPGRFAGHKRIATPVSLVDLVPTLMDLLGEPLPEGEADGATLVPLIEGSGPPPAAPVLSETIRRSSLSALRDGEWKYVLDMDSCAGELFDLAADPGETSDVSAAEPEKAARLRAAILDFYRDNPRSKRIPEVRMTGESREDLEQLEALGYVRTDTFGDVVTYAGLTDPGHCD